MDNKDAINDSEEIFEVVNIKKCKRVVKKQQNKKVEEQNKEEIENLLNDLGYNFNNIKW
jgi:hypothetical protein